MENVLKIVAIIGVVTTVTGGFWTLLGTIDFFQARKNRDKVRQDEGLESILYGGVITAVAGSITAVIMTQISSITF